ncbi:MAG: NAD(P)H-binding protein [Mycobacterium sp.]|uniref:NAD(P)-dependent oxidoreductase n=1 Tax=Mycobacterium sp. TaxID=1785 RepID=UPI003BB20042
MSVTIFGATGRIGRLVVADLLAGGHDVTVYVRNPGKLGGSDPRLVTVTGELSDKARILQAVRGSDAVISALGPLLRRGSKGTPVAEGTKNVVAAMQTEHVGRYIGLATPSVPDARDKPNLKAKILPIVAALLFPSALYELVGMTTAVAQSDLDWTIARITRPTSRKPKGTVRAGFLGRDKVGSVMSRADIAAFLIAQLTDETFSRAAPAISN